ncbi:MAG TPA: hypothetical protein PLT66_03535, partial [Bacillota bacterium]|nr:hypothetical protein [Bacillota bacterium]
LPALCVKPFAAAAVCGISAMTVYKLISIALGTLGSLRMRSAVALLPAVVVAVCVYFVVLLAIKGIPENELLMLPKGEKICSALRKMKLLGAKSTEGGAKR